MSPRLDERAPVVVRVVAALGWIGCLLVGAVTTWAMTAALMWGGLSYMLVAFALPIAATWCLLPPARTYRWWRWLAVLFVATQTAYPFTVFASTVSIGWLLHTLYVAEFGDHPDNRLARLVGRRPRTR